MKRKQSSPIRGLLQLKKAEHVGPEEYCHLRDQVNLCTHTINQWLSQSPEKQSDLTAALVEIFEKYKDQEAYIHYTVPFHLALYSQDLPTALQCDILRPYCQVAHEILTCHLLLLQEFIRRESLPVPAIFTENQPLYPLYDPWLIEALELVSQRDFVAAEAYACPVPAPESQAETELKIQAIIDAANEEEIADGFANAYFSKVCPICSELLKNKPSRNAGSAYAIYIDDFD